MGFVLPRHGFDPLNVVVRPPLFVNAGLRAALHFVP
jgi:hypothetical protein